VLPFNGLFSNIQKFNDNGLIDDAFANKPLPSLYPETPKNKFAKDKSRQTSFSSASQSVTLDEKRKRPLKHFAGLKGTSFKPILAFVKKKRRGLPPPHPKVSGEKVTNLPDVSTVESGGEKVSAPSAPVTRYVSIEHCTGAT